MTVAPAGSQARDGCTTDAPAASTAAQRMDAGHATAAFYRADVDGLRAIAVALTIAFHLDATGTLRGGFVGVDVFFVISGYLITGLLLRELGGGSFSPLAFWERRVRRIVPALTVVLALVLAGGFVILLPGDYRQMGRSALWALCAASNVFFLDNTGYFDAAASSMPLLHTWSLGVEEQFYLVWPLLLLLLTRAGRGRRAYLGLALAAVVAASFALNVTTVRSEPKAAFFLLQTRAWELGAGGLLALCPALAGGRVLGLLAEALPLAGLALIAHAATNLSSEQPYPGWHGLAPVVGAMLIVHDGGRLTLARRLLALRPLVFLGRISYSLYLLNWPLIVFWRLYTNGTKLTPTASVVLTVTSVVLAWLSWRWVEQPFRRPALPRRAVFTRAALAAASVAVAAWAVVATDGVKSRVPENARDLGDLVASWSWTCPVTPPGGLPSAWRFPGSPAPCVVGVPWETARVRAVLWGDSFAEHLLPLLDLAGRDTGTSIVLLAPCPAILDDVHLRRDWPEQPLYNGQCAAKRAATLDHLASHADVSLVILSSAWASLVDLLQRDGGPRLARKDGMSAMAEGLDRLAAALAAPGRRIVVFGDTPRVAITDPAACAVARVSPLLRDCPADLGVVAWRNVTAILKPVHDVLADVAARHPDVSLYRPEDHLCVEGRCDVEVEGAFLYRDGAHLRRNFTPQTLRAIVDRLRLDDLLRAPDAPA